MFNVLIDPLILLGVAITVLRYSNKVNIILYVMKTDLLVMYTLMYICNSFVRSGYDQLVAGSKLGDVPIYITRESSERPCLGIQTGGFSKIFRVFSIASFYLPGNCSHIALGFKRT